jgi:hypothetical protein
MNIARSVAPAYFKKVSTGSQRRSAAVIDRCRSYVNGVSLFAGFELCDYLVQGVR